VAAPDALSVPASARIEALVSGEGKSRIWHLSAEVYRALDAPSGYQDAAAVLITRRDT
jgi:hypothetical protein